MKKREDKPLSMKKRPAAEGEHKDQLKKARKEYSEGAEAERALMERLPEASPSEQDYLKDYLLMLRRLRKLIRASYERCLDANSGREVYALNVLMSQQREVIADIRTITDAGAQVEAVLQMAVSPMRMNFAQDLTTFFWQLRKLISETAKDDQTQFALEAVQKLISDMATAFDNRTSLLEEAVADILVGPTEQPKKKKGRRK